MRWLVALSLRNRIVVVALGVLLVVMAARTLRTTPLDVFPEFAPPLVEVQTEAPGLSTNDVESLVTVPLEAALNGIPGLDRIRSKSVLGLSSVVLILDPAGRRAATGQGRRARRPGFGVLWGAANQEAPDDDFQIGGPAEPQVAL